MEKTIMQLKIILHGRIPSKKNSRITIARGNRVFNFPSNEYQSWHKEQSLLLMPFKLKKFSTTQMVEMKFFYPDKRRRDNINPAESVLDFLVDNHIVEDDDYKCIPNLLLTYGGVEKENPRVEIIITP